MKRWFPRPGKGEMIDGGGFFSKKTAYFFQNFFYRNIFFSYKSLFCSVSDLAIDAVIGTNFMGDEVNPK
jgi:hypothetical protein